MCGSCEEDTDTIILIDSKSLDTDHKVSNDISIAQSPLTFRKN
jgi:hypothetical protein